MITEQSGRSKRALTLKPEDLPGAGTISHGDLAKVHINRIGAVYPFICAVAFVPKAAFLIIADGTSLLPHDRQ